MDDDIGDSYDWLVLIERRYNRLKQTRVVLGVSKTHLLLAISIDNVVDVEGSLVSSQIGDNLGEVGLVIQEYEAYAVVLNICQ